MNTTGIHMTLMNTQFRCACLTSLIYNIARFQNQNICIQNNHVESVNFHERNIDQIKLKSPSLRRHGRNIPPRVSDKGLCTNSQTGFYRVTYPSVTKAKISRQRLTIKKDRSQGFEGLCNNYFIGLSRTWSFPCQT